MRRTLASLAIRKPAALLIYIKMSPRWLGNDARQDVSYYYSLIKSLIRPFYWY